LSVPPPKTLPDSGCPEPVNVSHNPAHIAYSVRLGMCYATQRTVPQIDWFCASPTAWFLREWDSSWFCACNSIDPVYARLGPKLMPLRPAPGSRNCPSKAPAW
jgi:hypothetical protein